MSYTGHLPLNTDRPQARDCTVAAVVPIDAVGTAGEAVDIIGIFEEIQFDFKRGKTRTDGAHDAAVSNRATKWEEGSVRLSGYSSTSGSKLAGLFAGGSHMTLQFTENTSGDMWQVVCFADGYGKMLGQSVSNKDTLTLSTEGVPQFGPAGGALADLVLE